MALFAGCAAVLGQTAGRTNALVGVFISVTTVPAAGAIALCLALGSSDQLAGAAAQLAINLLGITVAGVLTLLSQRTLWRWATRRRAAQPEPASTAAASVPQ